MQRILTISTRDPNLRSKVYIWAFEDGLEARKVRLSCESARIYSQVDPNRIPFDKNLIYYLTPLHALGDGWKLLSSPSLCKEKRIDGKEEDCWKWWFTKH